MAKPENKIGHVTQRRYDNLVGRAQDRMHEMTGHQFAIGDMALEIEPMRPSQHGRHEGVLASLESFANDIGEVPDTMMTWRWVAGAWPAEKRCAEASYSVHRIFAPHPKRFTLIRKPPLDRRGRRHWTTDAAAQAVGRASSQPDNRVRRIRELAADDTVAATVASEFLDRPDVAGRVMANPTTRRQLYQAQYDHDRQVQDAARERTPAIKQVEHTIHFLDLLGTGHSFVTGIKRLMPLITENPLGKQEKDVIHHVLDQVQAAIDFCRSVMATGHLSMDEQLAKLLEEEGP